MPNLLDNFEQYSNGIADASYAFDFVLQVSIGAGAHTNVIFPVQTNLLRIRSVTVEDVTAAVGGSAPSAIACYYRIDGTIPTAGIGLGGQSSRIVKPSERQTIARWVASELGVTLFNPNAGTVNILVEVAG